MTPIPSYVAADTSEPVLDTTVGSVLQAAAAAAPDRVALVEAPLEPLAPPEAPRQWTFAEILADAERVAAALLDRFQPGDRVAVWAPNIAEWVLLEYGAGLAGMVLVTINPSYQPKELQYVLGQSRAAGLFYLPSFRGNPMESYVEQVRGNLPDLREIVSLAEWDAFLASGSGAAQLPDVKSDDAAQIQYTSGTTGFPKGALLHHRGLTNNARLFAERFGMNNSSTLVSPMPLFHCSGCVIAVLATAQMQATLINMVQFDPGRAADLLESHRATHMFGVPTMLIGMMEQLDERMRDLSSLAHVCSGGATVPAELVRRIEGTLGVDFSIVYGQTESSPIITMTKLDDSPDDKSGTLGPVLPQTEVKVVDPESGETVPTGTPGEMCTRGYLVMLEYFEMPERTAESIDEERWLHTGDLVTMDERGYTTITGRLKDMIIRGGENIYPRELEEVLFEHPLVADIAVVGLPDAKWGEVVGAFWRDADPAQPASRDELHHYLRQHLSPQKTPTIWVRLDEFPLTPSGKIQKFVIREQWEQGQYTAE